METLIYAISACRLRLRWEKNTGEKVLEVLPLASTAFAKKHKVFHALTFIYEGAYYPLDFLKDYYAATTQKYHEFLQSFG